MLRGVDVAEINGVDLFALECLRTFAPSSYEALSRNKLALTSGGRGAGDVEKDHIRTKVEGICALAPQDCREGVKQIIQKLFPTLDWAFRNTTYDGTTHAQWLRESRVCSAEAFDRYFELALPLGGVSNSQLQPLKSLLTDSEKFCDALRHKDESQQKEILDRLEAHIDDFPIEQSESVIETLLNAGEVVVSGQSTFTSLSPDTHLWRLLKFFLDRHQEPVIRSELLLRAFERAKGFIVLEHLLSRESSLRLKSEPCELDDAGFEQLRQMFVSELLKKADINPEAFLEHRRFMSFAYRLNAMADGAGSQWTKRHVTTLERFILFARSVVVKTTQYAGDVVTEHYSIRSSTLEELLGIEACRGWMSQVQQDTLDGPAKQAVELVGLALEKHQLGETSDWD